MVRELQPQDIAEYTDLRVIDIREPDERHNGIGFIPGSRHVAGQDIDETVARLIALYGSETPMVLFCMSGRRSLEVAAAMVKEGYSQVFNLSGGVLGWMAQGFPTCASLDDDGIASDHAPSSIEEFIRELSSCFVAETVENAINRDIEVPMDPRGYISGVVSEELSRSSQSPRDALFTTLDRVAETAREMGHPLERMAKNVNKMHALIERLYPVAS